MRVEVLLTRADTKTCSQPDKESRDREPWPVEHEYRGGGANVQKQQRDSIGPV
jgi:hypothetical protein